MPALMRPKALLPSPIAPEKMAASVVTVVPRFPVSVRLPPESVTGPLKIRLFSLAFVGMTVSAEMVTTLAMVVLAPVVERICPPARLRGAVPAPKGPLVGLPAGPVELTVGTAVVFAPVMVVPPV